MRYSGGGGDNMTMADRYQAQTTLEPDLAVNGVATHSNPNRLEGETYYSYFQHLQKSQ